MHDTGSTSPNVSGVMLGSLILSVPALETQKRIVDGLDNFLKKTRPLDSIYQQKLTTLDNLKKYLLHQL